MNVNGKYLKDESGNVISPVTSTNTVYDGNIPLSTILSNKLDFKVLWTGSILVPSRAIGGASSDISLTDNIYNYNLIVVQERENTYVRFIFDSSRTSLTFGVVDYSTWNTEAFNLFGFVMNFLNNGNKASFTNGSYFGTYTDGSTRFTDSYTRLNIRAVIGINFGYIVD